MTAGFGYEVEIHAGVKAGDTVRSISGQPFVVLSVEPEGEAAKITIRKPRGRNTFTGHLGAGGTACRVVGY